MFFNFSEIFDEQVVALLSKRISSDSNELIIDYREKLAENVGFTTKQLAIPHQVHSNNVQWITKAGNYSNCDGLITDNPEIVLTLRVADCVPIYLYDNKTKTRALVHAGWRGIVSQITTNTVKMMTDKGCNPVDIIIFCGPSIKECCYEVDEEVAKQFSEKSVVRFDSKFRVNLIMEIKQQLLKFGLVTTNIHQTSICSFEDELCHSYRRDGEKSGRMVAIFGETN